MLDEKLQENETVSYAAMKDFDTERLASKTKISELSTAFQNLKWGFRERFYSKLIHITNWMIFCT